MFYIEKTCAIFETPYINRFGCFKCNYVALLNKRTKIVVLSGLIFVDKF